MDDELSRQVDALPGLIWTARHDARADFVNGCGCGFGLTAAHTNTQGIRAARPPDLGTVPVPAVVEPPRTARSS